jgi:hypothetical protein
VQVRTSSSVLASIASSVVVPVWCRKERPVKDDVNQVEFAERLADVLNASDDYGIDAVDLLDALASTGLKLVDDSDGDATIAYHSRLSPDA